MKHNSYHTLLRNDAFKTVAIALLLLLLSPTTWAQNGKTEAYTGDAYIERTQEKKTPLILHGAGKVNVEKLKGKIDTQMDLSSSIWQSCVPSETPLLQDRDTLLRMQPYVHYIIQQHGITMYFGTLLKKRRPLVRSSHHAIRKNNLPLQSVSEHVKQNYES